MHRLWLSMKCHRAAPHVHGLRNPDGYLGGWAPQGDGAGFPTEAMAARSSAGDGLPAARRRGKQHRKPIQLGREEEGMPASPEGLEGGGGGGGGHAELKERLDRLDRHGIASLLQGPLSLSESKCVHACIVEQGLQGDTFVGNLLLSTYSRLGSLADAQGVFDRMRERNVVTWTAMISAYARHGHGHESLRLYKQMEHAGVAPNKVTFISVLGACASLQALEEGASVHARITSCHEQIDAVLGAALVNMYGKCGALQDAISVFDGVAVRDVVLWTALIAVHAQHGRHEESLRLFRRMRGDGLRPNKVTLVIALGACAGVSDLAEGKAVHRCIEENGLLLDAALGAALVNMYGKCGALEDACSVFNGVHRRDAMLWNAMMGAYSQHGLAKESLQLLHQMQQECVRPNKITFLNAVCSCTRSATRAEGHRIHAYVASYGFESDVIIGTALVNMYGKFGDLDEARSIFDQILDHDVASWNAMVIAYAQNGHSKEALQLFQQMQQEGFIPDETTFSGILVACAGVISLAECAMIHQSILNGGFISDLVVANALINAFGKCGALKDACSVFNNMPQHDVVSWNSLLFVYVQHGHSEVALKLFQQMQWEGLKPDKVTFLSVLRACGHLAAFAEGETIHRYVTSYGLEVDNAIRAALINMYGKCGALENARSVFDVMHEHDLVLWSAIVTAYAQNGHAQEALHLFCQMQQKGVLPDGITFISVLSACSHAGEIDLGHSYFASMCKDYGIIPLMEHYRCMIDLLGRAGQLHEAEGFIHQMPFQADASVWSTLLGACKLYGDVERGKQAAGYLVELASLDSASDILLSNMYAADGRWSDVKTTRNTMMKRSVNKQTASLK